MFDQLHPVGLLTLARAGLLAQTYQDATPEERTRLHSEAVAVAWPIVFNRVTRVFELRRGHPSCAQTVHRLADACLDRFHDDVEAVVEDTLIHARTAITNLEGWIVGRLRAATVDAHRRRRGLRGALQRPRLPTWLVDGLGHDPWLLQLATEMLVWVGVPTTAGASVWPVDQWVERRAIETGDWSSQPRVVEREIASVVAVMARRPQWYDNYVERPLGAKTPPVWSPPVDSGNRTVEPNDLSLVADHQIEDSHIAELAAVALATIEARSSVESDLHEIVASVIADVFGETDTADEIAALPHSAPKAGERAVALVSGPDLDRIVDVVRDILGYRAGPVT